MTTMLTERQTLALLCGLAQPATRTAAATELARHLGADTLLMLVRDGEVNALVPAPGFPATLPGGPSWIALLAACATPGMHRGEVAFPTRESALAPAIAHVSDDGVAVILIGGQPRALSPGELALPLVGALLRAENAAGAARGAAAAARESARHAQALAVALDTARSDLERAMEQSAELNQSLERAGVFREQFLGIVSHDLRGPLSAIVMGSATMLQRCELGAADVKTITRIASSAERMRRMINELLDFTRSRLGGGIEIEREAIDIHEICRQAVAELEMAHPEVSVVHHVGGNGGGLWDPLRLSQVVSNLLANGVTHGERGRPIHVRSHGEPSSVTLEVHNEGPAIAPECLPRIFDPFCQGEPHARRSGLGLGLFITHQIVLAHGGTITVESPASSGGTSFIISLPRRP